MWVESEEIMTQESLTAAYYTYQFTTLLLDEAHFAGRPPLTITNSSHYLNTHELPRFLYTYLDSYVTETECCIY